MGSANSTPQNNITTLARRLKPFLLGALANSPGTLAVLLNRIILLPNGTGDPSVYPKTAAGLSSAYTDSADSDAIYIPTGASLTINLNVAKAISIFGVSTYGFGSGPRVTLTGQHTFNNANIQLSQIRLTSAAAGSVTATVNGGSVVFDRCYIQNTGTGAARALQTNNDAKVHLVHTHTTSNTSTSGQAIEINDSSVVIATGGGASGYTSGGTIEINGGLFRGSDFSIANTNTSGYHIDNLGGTAHICGVYGFDTAALEMVDLRTSGTVTVFCGGGTSTTAGSTRYLGLYNYTFVTAPGTSVYRIGQATSNNWRDWSIGTEPVIDVGASTTWDDAHVKDPSVIEVDGVLYAYYSGHDGSVWKIGVAISYDGGATWTKYASNPILSASQAWENSTNNEVHTPVVIYDAEESNASKKFKMWYAGGQFGAGGIGYAYSADGLSWTKYASNPVISLGTAGAWDDTYALPGAVIRRGTQFVIVFNGNDGSGTWSVGYATFTNPESTYTKFASNPILQGDGLTTTITSNVSVSDTQISVTDATIFPIGAPVWVYDDDEHYLSHVVDRVSSTVIELDDAAPVAIASATGNVKSVAFNSVTVEELDYDDGYLFSVTAFQPGGGDLTDGVKEVAMLGFSDDLTSITLDYGAGVALPVAVSDSGTYDDISRENLSYIDTWDASRRQKPYGRVEVRDEGTVQGYAYAIDFTGAGVSSSVASDVATVTISGGGGGGLANVQFTKRTSSNLTLNSTTWADVDTGIDLAVTASTGDILEVSLSGLFGNEAVNCALDAATIVSAAPVNYIGTGGGASDLGVQGWLGLSGVNTPVGASICYTVQAGDISGGSVTMRLRYRTTAASNKTLNAGATQPLQWSVKNLSQ